MLNELAALLHYFFATDQASHAQHQPDGKYRRKPGAVTKKLLEKTLRTSGSLAIYQKNNDLTVKWICFDFDILKPNLENELRQTAQNELERAVNSFCNSLNKLNIPYLLEFSGNRGFHVWITFSEKTSYRTGYEIQQALIESTQLHYNKDLIGVDLFPSSGTPTDGTGLGVKVPLSKHTKSKRYAVLLKAQSEIATIKHTTELNSETIKSSLEILKQHKSTSKSELETALGVIFNFTHDETFRPARIKSIGIQNNGFTLDALQAHWNDHPPLHILGNKIKDGGNLNNEDRKLLVGMLYNIKAKNLEDAGQKILVDIFSKSENYNPEITIRSIKKLSSFNFPSQEQIETTTNEKFPHSLTVEELIKACIPTYTHFTDATFEISKSDIEITKTAELNYLFLNDEAQSKVVMNELSSTDSYRLLNLVNDVIQKPKSAEFYKHLRNEEHKVRTLITLKAPERLTTSCILKQLIYFLNIPPSSNSHGYKPNKGFSDGYIFQPWLYLWIKFVSNISSGIEDPDNKNYYILKTDIKSFYDTIPHDNLKRMLLGGVNPRIDAKLIELSPESKSSYQSHIDTLFEITEKAVNSKVGLPQGPAYARYLAELYLDNLDLNLDSRLQLEEIQLYQRYVDDIFIITPSEDSAKSALALLRAELELLGLDINNEKTSITKIGHFSKDFNTYRSQSKYAVDKVSRNFADSTTTQKNLAITEFIKLVQSDSCNDDLAFIFSHLAGVATLDPLKREKVQPTLNSRIGRGSLYKHLFSFVLDSPENWNSLESVDYLDELQSEVFTASLITALESSKSASDDMKKLFTRLEKKLSKSQLTYENLTYLALVFDVEIDLKEIPSQHIINCLISLPENENLKINKHLVEQLNTALNDIKELPRFIEAMYPLCASLNTERKDLNDLAATFYAKLSTDERNGKLSIDSPPEICAPSTASKYYYLLCLFSISNRNKSTELLRSSWKYCAHVFNTYETEILHRAPDWFKKISHIEYSQENVLLLISTIVDGNIFRGLVDKRKIFEKFHSLLLIYITLQDNDLKNASIEKALDELKDKADFYKWLIDKDQTSIFPTTNKSWFEKNIIENSSIVLKREKSILFRKPTTNFHSTSSPLNEHNGYSEIVVDYTPENLKTLTESISEQSTGQKLKKLIDIINLCRSSGSYPNIFCKDRLLTEDTLLPFSQEFINSRTIILEDRNGNIETLVNNQKNFIKGYFRSVSSQDTNILIIKDKYIDNLNETIDTVEFIKHLLLQIEEISGSEDSFHFDLAAAGALYLSIEETEPAKRIEKFVDQYHRFNQNDSDRHIYAVDQSTTPNDSTPIHLLNTIETVLKLIPTTVTPSLALYLHIDIDKYRKGFCDLLERHCAETSVVDPVQFKRIRPIISPINESLHFDDRDHSFDTVQLVNITTNEVHQFETKHSIALSSSEHVYSYQDSSGIYIAAMHSAISKIYKSITTRLELYSSKSNHFRSYPTTIFDEKNILSLNGFSSAIDVVSTHRDISKTDAHSCLVKWLSSLPRKFHQALVTLISAHTVIYKEDIYNFTKKVESLLSEEGSNPFLIKHIGDYNGTHRVLFKDNDIGRSIESLSPANIRLDSERATIITDTIITGSQIISSMKFYLTGIETKSNSNNFLIPFEHREAFISTFKKIKFIDICTIVYTKTAIKNIETYLKDEMNEIVKVNVICGKDLGEDALFGTTSRIGEQDKDLIRTILRDQESMQNLRDHLDVTPAFKRSKSNIDEEINKTNLVARYQSLPKKCFEFLKTGLRHEPTCHPLTRISELNE